MTTNYNYRLGCINRMHNLLSSLDFTPNLIPISVRHDYNTTLLDPVQDSHSTSLPNPKTKTEYTFMLVILIYLLLMYELISVRTYYANKPMHKHYRCNVYLFLKICEELNANIIALIIRKTAAPVPRI